MAKISDKFKDNYKEVLEEQKKQGFLNDSFILGFIQSITDNEDITPSIKIEKIKALISVYHELRGY